MTDSRGPMHMCRAEFIPGKQQGVHSHTLCPWLMDPRIPRPTFSICSGLSLTPPCEPFLQITVTFNSFVLPLEVILIEIANTHRCQPFFSPSFLDLSFSDEDNVSGSKSCGAVGQEAMGESAGKLALGIWDTALKYFCFFILLLLWPVF